MKKIFILLITFYSFVLAEQIPYTLENLKKLNLYYVDKSGLFTKEEIHNIKQSIEKKLLKTGFELNAVDPSTLVIKIETINIDDTTIANITLLVGEEVVSKRKGSVQTLALTFHLNNFIELDEPKEEISQYIDSMLGEFIKLYNEDMEQ